MKSVLPMLARMRTTRMMLATMTLVRCGLAGGCFGEVGGCSQPAERDDGEQHHLLAARDLQRQDVGHDLHEQPHVGDHVDGDRGPEVGEHSDADAVLLLGPDFGDGRALEHRHQLERDGGGDDEDEGGEGEAPVQVVGEDAQVEEADAGLGEGEGEVVEEQRGVLQLQVAFEGWDGEVLDVDAGAVFGREARGDGVGDGGDLGGWVSGGHWDGWFVVRCTHAAQSIESSAPHDRARKALEMIRAVTKIVAKTWGMMLPARMLAAFDSTDWTMAPNEAESWR